VRKYKIKKNSFFYLRSILVMREDWIEEAEDWIVLKMEVEETGTRGQEKSEHLTGRRNPRGKTGH
jgi:hypothetical protein